MRRKSTKRIIYHHSLADVSTVEMIRRWHIQRGFSDIGYAAVVRRDGSIEYGRDHRDTGAHALGKNHDSIGVCLEGDFRRYEPTPEQLESCCILQHRYCRFYGASLAVEFHRLLSNPCPGPMLDRTDFQEIVSRADPYLTIDTAS